MVVDVEGVEQDHLEDRVGVGVAGDQFEHVFLCIDNFFTLHPIL